MNLKTTRKMKNFLKYVAALAIVGAFFVACSDWTDPEREITQHPDQQSPILRDNASVSYTHLTLPTTSRV